jgi:hypothetical protein
MLWRIARVTVLAGTIACVVAPIQAQEGSPYRIDTSVVREAGGGARLSLTIHGLGEWKWNDEFPFSLAIDREDGVKPGRDRFGTDDVQVAADHKSASVSVGRVPAPARLATMTGKASFALCVGDRCRQFRNVEVAWAIEPGR